MKSGRRRKKERKKERPGERERDTESSRKDPRGAITGFGCVHRRDGSRIA
ncbi:hypothetical protein Scep_029610 [Stephania cephalantha]|uniref:Uncharacterized protein n=1 Tax=Stephania cephalantha TaxID=152367 RepID=A0AAP0E5N5_9MAGN